MRFSILTAAFLAVLCGSALYAQIPERVTFQPATFGHATHTGFYSAGVNMGGSAKMTYANTNRARRNAPAVRSYGHEPTKIVGFSQPEYRIKATRPQRTGRFYTPINMDDCLCPNGGMIETSQLPAPANVGERTKPVSPQKVEPDFFKEKPITLPTIKTDTVVETPTVRLPTIDKPAEKTVTPAIPQPETTVLPLAQPSLQPLPEPKMQLEEDDDPFGLTDDEEDVIEDPFRGDSRPTPGQFSISADDDDDDDDFDFPFGGQTITKPGPTRDSFDADDDDDSSFGGQSISDLFINTTDDDDDDDDVFGPPMSGPANNTDDDNDDDFDFDPFGGFGSDDDDDDDDDFSPGVNSDFDPFDDVVPF